MKLIELHILQSFPVSCLNRDDVGAPKSAIFGGVVRARLSSQCLKRAIRLHAHEIYPNLFAGKRSRLIVTELAQRLEKLGVDQKLATETAKQIGGYLATLDEKAEKAGVLKVKTLMFLSPMELDSIATAVAEILAKTPKAKEIEKVVAKACKQAALKDAADIAIFGRMVASDHSLTVEGAGLFSHALSTHKADNDLDFFAAVDDLQPAEEAGAGMTGTLEFTAATYYRFAALNLEMLADEDHLSGMTEVERKQVVDAFLRASILAVPGARRNSMNAHTMPGYVLGIVKTSGQPIQLINAFEKPVFSKNGLMQASVDALKSHYDQLKKTWNLDLECEVTIPDASINIFCEEILKHV
jgi:CRISPR system Cascade subunit CasC